MVIGADRIAADADVANKLGSFSQALGTRQAGVPFIVVAPKSTIDVATPDGQAIDIGDRRLAEVIAFRSERTAPEGQQRSRKELGVRMSRSNGWIAVVAAGLLLLAGCSSTLSPAGSTPPAGAASTPAGSSASGAGESTPAGSGQSSGSEPASGSSAQGSGPSVPKGDHKFIYITNNPIGINEFLQLGKDGTQSAAKKYGGTAKIYESTDVVSQKSNLEAAVSEKPDVIVLITFDFTDLAKQYANDNPDQQFLLIDACPTDPPSNLHCAVFREQEASYLIGIEAGMLTKSNKIGAIVAQDIPFLHRYSDAFAQGAKSVNSKITNSDLYIGGDSPFADPAKAKEQALALASTGADQIFAVGAGSNGGTFDAAKQNNFFSYGVDINQCPMAPNHIVDNTMKAVDVLVVDEIGQILVGTAKPVSSYGLKEKGMDLTSLQPGADASQCLAVKHPDVITAVKSAKQKIIDGILVIHDPAAG